MRIVNLCIGCYCLVIDYTMAPSHKQVDIAKCNFLLSSRTNSVKHFESHFSFSIIGENKNRTNFDARVVLRPEGRNIESFLFVK